MSALPAEMIGPEVTDPDRLRMMWLAVLVEGVNTALGHGVGKISVAQRVEAVSWIGSQDFDAVCGFIGIEPTVVLMQIETLREMGLPFEVEVWG
ncbi:hypothetical protein [Celeribacter ethanolicus]|uniref:hypothetical protein n=1 Tax=Celeribacter ethanolicus TaxID=1758178 RepID=UPI00083113B1|nr:hypothetical protein [Celeribacter ethanolicus]